MRLKTRKEDPTPVALYPKHRPAMPMRHRLDCFQLFAWRLSVCAGLAWLLFLFLAQPVNAQIYRMSMDIQDGMSLPERAEAVRQQLPLALAPPSTQLEQQTHLPSALPQNPLLPGEPRFAQVPEGPEWAIPENESDGPLLDPNSDQFDQPNMPSNVQTDQTYTPPNTGDGQRIRIDPRGGGETSVRVIPRGSERAIVVNTPTQITLLSEQGPIELSADSIVVWADENVVGLNNLDASQTPVEIYLEGNIEFRQAGNVGLAQRMYYNVANQTGVILEAELFGETSQRANAGSYDEFRTPFRMKSDVIQQLSPTLFQANNAAFTTSRLGVPQYWIESGMLRLDTGTTPLINQLASLGTGLMGQTEEELYQQSGYTQNGGYGFGDVGGGPGYNNDLNQPNQNPFSGFDQLLVTSNDTRLFVGGFPLFRWPTFSADLANNPSLYLDRIRVGSDSVFGQQLLTRWNNFQLFGIRPRPGVRWTTDLDYLTERGLGFGTDLEYRRNQFFGSPAQSRGYLHSWFINDNGEDNLGFDRRSVVPESDFRGRIDGKHMHLTPSGWQVIGELGWISDRNFLEQFREEEWDLQKDKETRLELKRYTGNGSWSIGGALRLNDFVTQTEWLPRADHYTLGRGLLGNRLNWYEHSQLGYYRLKTAEAPTNAVDLGKFDPLAWDRRVEGVRAVSRQEIDMPLELGPIKVVPYLLGEAGYWQEDLTGDDVTRLLGQAGIRTSLLMWRADPNVYNELFNLNGIAHKIVVDSEFLVADSTQDYLSLPLLDPLDDDSIEFFRRRFLFDTFSLGVGDDVPLKFDERVFAFRQGLQRFVTSPSTEIADDLMMLRLGWRQRIQTKRGRNQRIVDWMTFDVESHFFPRASRDNFGQEIGPTQYDLRWHVGDRTTLMSDGYFDFFGSGLRTVSVAAALTRPGRSQYFLGLRTIDGPVSSDVLTASLAYRLSSKWKLEYGTSFDFGSTGNIGHSGRVVRIGESILVGLGAYYDASRNNFGFRFDIAPRVLRSKLGMIGGRPIPPVGAFGLE